MLGRLPWHGLPPGAGPGNSWKPRDKTRPLPLVDYLSRTQ